MYSTTCIRYFFSLIHTSALPMDADRVELEFPGHQIMGRHTGVSIFRSRQRKAKPTMGPMGTGTGRAVGFLACLASFSASL